MTTKSTERWHQNGFNLCEVIIIRDGPCPKGHHYIDGRHQISVAKFDRIEDARAACIEHNQGLD